jgi:hypothetical protein
MQTFSEWLESHHHATKKSPVLVPQSEELWLQIRDAGRRGASYGELAGRIKLKPETLQAVIQSLVDFGRVKVYWERGQRIYRPK